MGGRCLLRFNAGAQVEDLMRNKRILRRSLGLEMEKKEGTSMWPTSE